MWSGRLERGYVYVITNIINQKIYIGQTWYALNHRLSQHKSQKKRGCPLLHKAIEKYGKDSFTIESLARFDTQSEADLLEIYFIDYYCSSDQKYGYNLTKGGQDGRPSMPIETRQKISQSRMGQKASLQTRQKQSASQKAKSLPIESQQRLDKSRVKKRKLTMEQAEHIRIEYKDGSTLKELSLTYNVSIYVIHHIVHNITYINDY